ncbi:hypothetical protein E2562_003266 [Oryza meyeriana var. granulata]|uniref:Uncharacterized protein n=1 Tax=Oryza meyeriana var. granulata TaxID=110450 RepID=A0A6G1EE21_9ORYZ|nr:hypothetical protein E2562_003266 [Oryza meyeriana var. granulata]
MRSNSMKAATTACMPRLMRGSCRASTARPAASVSLLERIRDVVLRLIMLSAVSKASVKRSDSGTNGKASSSPRAGWRRERAPTSAPVTCRRDDSIRNEAVEDCIEFLKRSSAEGDAAKLSSVTAADTVFVARDLATKPLSPSSVIITDAVTAHGEPAKEPSIDQHLAASSPASPVSSGAVGVGLHRSTSPATSYSPMLV